MTCESKNLRKLYGKTIKSKFNDNVTYFDWVRYKNNTQKVVNQVTRVISTPNPSDLNMQ